MQNQKPIDMSFFAFELPFLYSSCSVLFPFSIECLQRPWPPIVYYQPIPHNTQTNKVSYLNSQAIITITNNQYRIKPVVCTKKVDSGYKLKTQTLK